MALIREIDESIVSGLGGYSTRTEIFRDAAEGLLLELKYEPAPEGPIANRGGTQLSASASAVNSTSARNLPAERSTDGVLETSARRLASLDETALRLKAEGTAVAEDGGRIDDEPLFGMH